VERLRESAIYRIDLAAQTMAFAADEIERLRAERDEVMKLLGEFAPKLPADVRLKWETKRWADDVSRALGEEGS
jgi:hypothetical protein